MRILCVIDSLGAGGAQRQIVALALGFKEKGYSVSFLTYYYNSFFISTLQNNGIAITCIEESNYLKRLYKMCRFIRQGNFNAVLSFLEGANFICQFAGLPYRKWQLVVGERSANPEILNSFKLKVFRWFHFFADYVVANSNTNMEYVNMINPLLPKSKCRVVYNMVDFEMFKPSNKIALEQPRKFILVIPARIRIEKNINRLIEAVLLLNDDEREKLKIDWYGKYKHEEKTNPLLIESLVQIKQNGLESMITFHEATHDIRTIMQQSDAVGLFSTFEGFPNAICEAMACAKPVICSSVSDMDCFLSHEPRLLCDPINPHSIKKSLSYLISMNRDQLEKIGLQNRNIAIDKFEKETIISSYLQLLGEKN